MAQLLPNTFEDSVSDDPRIRVLELLQCSKKYKNLYENNLCIEGVEPITKTRNTKYDYQLLIGLP